MSRLVLPMERQTWIERKVHNIYNANNNADKQQEILEYQQWYDHQNRATRRAADRIFQNARKTEKK